MLENFRIYHHHANKNANNIIIASLMFAVKYAKGVTVSIR